jgi:hypothetical protein
MSSLEKTSKTSQIKFDEKLEPYFETIVETRSFDTVLREWRVTKTEKLKETLESHGYLKDFLVKLIIVKQKTNEDFQVEMGYYLGNYRFSVPMERANKYIFLQKVRSGEVFVTDVDSGVTSKAPLSSCSEVEFQQEGRLQKISKTEAEKLLLSRQAIGIFKINPTSSELERWLST